MFYLLKPPAVVSTLAIRLEIDHATVHCVTVRLVNNVLRVEVVPNPVVRRISPSLGLRVNPGYALKDRRVGRIWLDDPHVAKYHRVFQRAVELSTVCRWAS